MRIQSFLSQNRFHDGCETLGVDEKSIWNVRLEFLEKYFLGKWENFSIWSAGKQGRRLFRDLEEENQKKVLEFCDVDQKKIGKNYEYQETKERPKICLIYSIEFLYLKYKDVFTLII